MFQLKDNISESLIVTDGTQIDYLKILDEFICKTNINDKIFCSKIQFIIII